MIFTMEEVNNNINFLDITIPKDEHKISFNIYRKTHCNRHYYFQWLLSSTRRKNSRNKIFGQLSFNIHRKWNKKEKKNMTQ